MKKDDPVRITHRIVVILLFTGMLGAHAAQQSPNFIIIMADDLGWADISIQGEKASRDVSTPNIDRLFREGMRLTSAYVASATCGPSRSSLLTGRSSSRFALEDNQP